MPTAARKTPTRPAPQDHLQKRAARKAEAVGGSVVVTHHRHRFTVSTDVQQLPVEVLEAFEDGKVVTGVRALLGPEQWEAYKADRPTVGDMTELFDKIARAIGFGSGGESSASPA